MTSCQICIDLFELCIEIDESRLIDEAWVTLSFPPGIFDYEAVHPEILDHALYCWGGQSGRVEVLPVSIPVAAQCADLILSVYTREKGWLGDTIDRFAYARVPAVDFVAPACLAASWLDLYKVVAGGIQTSAGSILLSIHTVHNGSIPRPPRPVVEYKKFAFRALIGQIVNLPATDPSGSADGFCVVFFGPAMMTTPIYAGSTCPSWYEILEAEVEIPIDVEMRPPVTIYVLDRDESQNDIMAKMKYDTSSTEKLPVQWGEQLQWFDLARAPSGPLTQSRILCGFELVPLAEARKHPRLSIEPPTNKFKVELFVIGVRLWAMEHLTKPQLEAAWGREDTDRRDVWVEPKSAKLTKEGRGSSGKYNFCELLTFKALKLATNPIYQDWLEVKLIADSAGSDDGTDVICCGNVHLTPHMPYVDKRTRKRLEEQYRYKSTAEIQREEAATLMRGVSLVAHSKKSERKANDKILDDSKAQTIVRAKERELEELLAWRYNDITTSNSQVKGQGYEHYCFDERDGLLEPKVSLQPNRADENWDPNEQEMLHMEFDHHAKTFKGNFKWPQYMDVDDGLGERKELDRELGREELAKDELPYLTTTLFRGVNGTQQDVGVLKYIVRVVDRRGHKEDNLEVTKSNQDFQERMDRLTEMFNKEMHKLVVRAYILTADGLAPLSDDGQHSFYPWSYLGTADDPDYNNRDEKNMRVHSLSPQFNVLHQYRNVEFPEHSIFRLNIVQRRRQFLTGTETDEVVGFSLIDLEDRYFHPSYGKIVSDEVTPVEARLLTRGASLFGRGHARLWVDVMEQREAESLRECLLPSTTPEVYEVRIVVWKMTDISTLDEGSPCTQIFGRYTYDDGTVEEKYTDCHKDTLDAAATFNWRLIFRVQFPSRQTRLNFVAKNVGTFSSDTIGEVTITLEKDLSLCARTGAEVRLPRGYMRLHNSKTPEKVRGVLEIEGVVMHSSEARSRPQGVERKEPNDDPFLNPEDPHLLKGRVTMLRNIAAAAGDVANLGLKLGRCALYMGMLQWVGAGLLALVGTGATVTALVCASGNC